MEDQLLDQWRRFKAETGDPLAAAILAVGCLSLTNATRKTGLTTAEAAKFLGVCPATIRDLSNKGEIKRHKFGRRSVRFSTEDLEAFQRRQPPTEDAHPDSHLHHFNRKKQPC